MVRVCLDIVATLCELQLGLWNDLVEGESSSSEDLAGVAVAGQELVRNTLRCMEGKQKHPTKECASVGLAEARQSRWSGHSGTFRRRWWSF